MKIQNMKHSILEIVLGALMLFFGTAAIAMAIELYHIGEYLGTQHSIGRKLHKEIQLCEVASGQECRIQIRAVPVYTGTIEDDDLSNRPGPSEEIMRG